MNQAAIEELERRIEETRLALDQTLNDLRVEISPRHQLGLAWRWAGGHPLPISLVLMAACGLYLSATQLVRLARPRH